MANGANGVHLQLREALEDYIKSQYFGKSPILLSAVQNKLDQEGILYQKPYIESSPAYKSELNGIQKSSKLPDWVKAYFDALANADLGVYSSPFAIRLRHWKPRLLEKISLFPREQVPVKRSALCGLYWQSLRPRHGIHLPIGLCVVSERSSCIR